MTNARGRGGAAGPSAGSGGARGNLATLARLGALTALAALAGCGTDAQERDLRPLLERVATPEDGPQDVVAPPALLAPGEAAGVSVLVRGSAELVVEASVDVPREDGRPRGAGTLEVRATRVDPFAGLGLHAAGAEPEPLVHLRLVPRAGRVREDVTLPGGTRGLVRVEVEPVDDPAAGGGPAPSWTIHALALREEGEHPRPPSIVFVSVDTLAARHLSAYDYARETSPRLDLLARESVLFERCSANAPWTTPSYASQLSGLLPGALVHAGGEGGETWYLPPALLTLPEALRALGYRTAAFVDNPNVPPELGFDQGFEVYDTSAARIPKTDHAGGIRKVTADGLAWLDGLGADEPYFLFLQCLDVHAPYVPPESTRGAFEGDDLDQDRTELPIALQEGNVFDAVPHYVAAALPDGAPTAADPTPATLRLADLRRAYDEEILALDEALGELFDALRARGVLDEALLVVSADHGESFAHHSYCGHVLPYEDVLHVPLIVRLPGASGGGRRVADVVQLVDLYPTLLDVTGAPLAPSGLHGRSLRPALHGGRLASRPAVCQTSFFGYRSVRHGDAKLVEGALEVATGNVLSLLTHPRMQAWLARELPVVAGRVPGTTELPLERLAAADLGTLWAAAAPEVCAPFRELYDLERDPDELVDQSAESPALAERLRGILDAAEAQAAAARARLAGGPGPGEVDPELKKALAALGYADGG